MFQHTAARRRLLGIQVPLIPLVCFNTQPPEGDWVVIHSRGRLYVFQHTAARRRLSLLPWPVSSFVCFNTQPPEGDCAQIVVVRVADTVSTHSRPKATGQCKIRINRICIVSTHSRPKATALQGFKPEIDAEFQHTAARRRLLTSLSDPMGRSSFNTQPPEGD